MRGDYMPIPFEKEVRCKKCGVVIKTIRLGDAIKPEELLILVNSYCKKCRHQK